MNITLNPSSVADYATFLRVKSLPVYRIQGREAWFPDEYASRLGIDPVESEDVAPRLHKDLFDYQRDIAKLAIQKKRFAVFADCGLGKTLIMLEFARHVRRVLPKKRVLIISPLMVIEQTIAEHERWYGTSHKLEQVASSGLGKWTQGKVGAIGVLQLQHQRPRAIAVDQRGPPPVPRSGNGKTVVTGHGMAGIIAGQGHAAQIADQSGGEGRVAPAGGAQAKVAADRGSAGDTARRIDQMQRRLHPPGLQSHSVPLWSRPCRPRS